MNRTGILVLCAALTASIASAADLTISTSPDSNIIFVNGGFEPIGPGPGNLNTTNLAAQLSFAPVTLRASGDVIFENALIWSSASGLRVEAGGDVTLQASITNLAGAQVRLRADSGGTGIGTIQAGVFTVTAGSVEAFYNPTVFPTPSVLWIGGTAPTAYMLVNTRTNLQTMSANLAANYALGRDIDAAGLPFTPVGSLATPFTGRFEGNGQAIRNLNVAQAGNDYAGLFGAVSNASIRNVRIVDATVIAANQAGILAGAASNTTVIRVFTTGNVTATNSTAGGLAGTFHGSLSESASTASVFATTTGGGLIGLLAPGATVFDVYATGAVVVANSIAGGLVGTANGASIANSYSAGAVMLTAAAGGFVGSASGTTFSSCFWDVLTSGQALSAGGSARITAQMRQQATFAGWDFGNVWSIIEGKTYPYIAALAAAPATGDLVISTQPTANVTLANGVFQATASSAVLNVNELTTALASSNVIVRTPSLSSGDLAIVAPISWSSPYRLRVEAGDDIIVAANISGTGSLQLRSETGTIVGPGTTSSSFTSFFYNPASFATPTNFSSFGGVAAYMLIHDRTQLEGVTLNCTGSYALASDLDLGGTPLLPLCAGLQPFEGKFSGDFHAIRGLVIDRPTTDAVGLFGKALDADIHDLRIENASVTGRSQVGILIGHVLDGETFVDRVLVSGSVTASGSAAGGLVGQSDGSGFSETASSASITSTGAGQDHFGGVFGLANPSGFYPVTFNDSYASGVVSGGTSGAVGGHGGTTNAATLVSSSFSTGAVTGASPVGGLLGNGAGTEFQDYWNAETSGQASAGFGVTATGLTSSQMRSAGSFASWDFSSIWNIFESIAFPFLRIEDKAVVSAPPSVVAGTQLTYTFAAAASKQSYENVIPVAFAHAIPAGTALVSSALPAAPMNVAPGWSGIYDVTVSVGSSTTGTLPIAGTFTTPTFTGAMNATVAVTTVANLSVAVSASPDPVSAGGMLTYTVTVANAGPSDAATVVVSHALPAGVSLIGCTAGCAATSLAAGGSAIFIITASVPASLASGATLSATTSVASATSDPDLTNNSVATDVMSSASADLSIVAAASAAEAGSPMTWTVTVTNNGPSDSANVSVAHTLGAVSCSASCAATTIAAGASVVFTLDEIVAASTAEGTTRSGTFTVSSATPDSNAANDSATASAIVATSADLAVTNVVATSSNAGEPATWTVTVSNQGPSDAADVTLSFGAPPEINGITCTGGCTAASIGAGSNVVFTIDGVIDPAAASGTVVSLTANASATTADSIPANNSATALFTTGTAADLELAYVAIPPSATAGTTFPFTVEVTNFGPSTASSVTLSLPVPPGVTFSAISAPPGWSCTPALTCTIAALPVRTDSIALTAEVDAAAIAPFALTSIVTAASADPASSNNSVAANVSVETLAPLTVEITDAPDPVAPNGSITYTITVTNAGPSVATDVPFSIALAPGLSATLPPATIALLPVGAQTFVIDATVDGLPGSTLTTTVTAGAATASATTGVASPSSMTIAKSVAGTSFAVSEPVTYTITITNNGTATQFDNPGDEMTDLLPAALTLTSATASAGTITTAGNEVRWNGTLAPGASATITIEATVTSIGPITNEATIRFDADGNGTNESTIVSNAVTINATALQAIPTASTWVLLALIAALSAAGWLRS